MFTYFEERLQEEMLARMARILAPGGVLWIGKREELPARHPGWIAVDGPPGFWRADPAIA